MRPLAEQAFMIAVETDACSFPERPKAACEVGAAPHPKRRLAGRDPISRRQANVFRRCVTESGPRSWKLSNVCFADLADCLQACGCQHIPQACGKSNVLDRGAVRQFPASVRRADMYAVSADNFHMLFDFRLL